MPLDENRKRLTLQKLGYDATKFDIDDSFNIIPRAPVAAPEPTSQTVSAPASSASGAFLRSAKEAIAPVLGGLGGTALGLGLAPASGGLSLALPILGSIGGSLLGSATKEAIAPLSEEEKAQLAADREQHQVASIAGSVAPMLLTGKPSLQSLKDMTWSARNAAAGRVMSLAEKSNIINQGVNAGLGLGLGVGVPLVQGREIDSLQVGADVAAGAVLGDPRGWVQKITGLQGHTRIDRGAPQFRAGEYGAPPPPEVVQKPAFSYEDLIAKGGVAGEGGKGQLNLALPPEVAARTEIQRRAALAAQKPDLTLREKIITDVNPSVTIKPSGKEVAAVAKPARESAADMAAVMREDLATMPEAAPYSVTPQTVEAARLKAESEAIDAALAKTPPPKTLLYQQERVSGGQTPDALMPSGGKEELNEAAQQAKQILANKQATWDARQHAKKLAEWHASQLEDVPSIEMPGGATARGEMDVAARRGKLAESATKDTGYHEVFHMAQKDIEASGSDKFGKELVKRGREMHGGEEGLTEAVGLRLEEANRTGEVAQWDKQFLKWAAKWFKVKMGTATPKDVVDMLAYKSMFDAKVADRVGLPEAYRAEALRLAQGGATTSQGGQVKNQPEESIDQRAKQEGFNVGPLLHGSPVDFNTFDSSKVQHGKFGKGFYAQDKEATAKVYAGDSGVIKNVYLKLNNPFKAELNDVLSIKEYGRRMDELIDKSGIRNEVPYYMDKASWNEYLDAYGSKSPYITSTGKNTTSTRAMYQALIKLLGEERFKKLGYDGAIIDVKPDSAFGADKEYLVFSPEQIKSADIVTRNDAGDIIPVEQRFNVNNHDMRYQGPVSEKLAATQQEGEKKVWLPTAIQSPLAALRKIGTKSTNYLADKFESVAESKNELIGQFYNKQRRALNKLNDAEDIELAALLNRERQERVKLRDQLSSDKLRVAYDEVRTMLKNMQKRHVAEGKPIIEFDAQGNPHPRLMGMDEFYVPNVIDVNILDHLRRNTPEAAQLRDEFVKWRMEKTNATEQQANEILDAIVASAHGSGGGGGHYGASSLEEGVGLPPNWRAKSLKETLDRYTMRWANDVALYKHIDSDPVARKILQGYGIRDPWMKGEKLPETWSTGEKITPYSDPNVQFVLDTVNLKRSYDENLFNAVSRVVKSALIGPQSKVKDVAANIPLMMQYSTFSDMPGLVTAGLTNWRRGLETALNHGFAREGSSAFQEALTGTSDTIAKLNKLAELSNKYQGAEFMEKLSRGMATAMSEFLIKQNMFRAKNSIGGPRETAQRFLDEFSRGTIKGGEATQEQIEKAAIRLAQKVQSTYDYRDLPRWMLESGYLPAVFSLSKWSVAQTNAFLTRAQKDPSSLLTGLFGAAVGGALTEELVDKMSGGRKLNIPTFKEAAESKTLGKQVEMDAYRATAMLQYVGYMGILNDVAKIVQDGMNKNNIQTYAAPAASVVGNTLEKTLDAAQAVSSGEPVLDVAAKWVGDMAVGNVQSARLLNAQLNPKAKEALEKRNASRDLRVFNMTQGNEVSDFSNITANPYMKLEEKKFKEAKTMPEAVAALPAAMKAALGKGNTWEERQKNLQALRSMQVRTMPSPKEDPQKFAAYLQFIAATQGEEARKKALADYVSQQGLIRAKQSLVPRL